MEIILKYSAKSELIIYLYGFCFSQIDKIMNSIDVGINSELKEMNGETTSKETFVLCCN